MLIKLRQFISSTDYYKTAVIIICVNAIFEIAFQYRFQTDIEEFYFLISVFISAIGTKNMIKKDNERYLPSFYCFWPMIILCIRFYSDCKLPILPFAASAYIILFCGRFKKKIVKWAAIFFCVVMVLINGFFEYILSGAVATEVIKTVYSPDNKYVMVLEERNITPGGEVVVYVGRNIDFGLMGRYMPVKRKYYGHYGERPALRFVDSQMISINGELIEINGGNYIDDY